MSVELFILLLIVYSVVTMTLETMPEMLGFGQFFFWSEAVVVGIFSVEYLIRWRTSDKRLSYPFRPMAVIDLLAILPFYLHLGIDLRSLRAVRLLRIFRILRLGRYSQSIRTLGAAIQRAAPELTVFGFVVVIVILISATALYYAERDAQPDVYRSIPASLWWAVVTLTTVGYGDVYPATVFGRIVATFIMLTGIGLVAVPTGIISSQLTDLVREERAESEPSHRIAA